MQAYPTKPREQWILDWPGQVVIAVGQTYWTRAVTEAIATGGTFGLQQLEQQNTKELLEEVRRLGLGLGLGQVARTASLARERVSRPP